MLPSYAAAVDISFEEEVRSFLNSYSWPIGLQEAVLKCSKKTPYRFFIVDDSVLLLLLFLNYFCYNDLILSYLLQGSMITNDGHKLIGSGPTARMIDCSRWSELAEALKFHAGLAHRLHVPTEFRFLNMSLPINIGEQVVTVCLNP